LEPGTTAGLTVTLDTNGPPPGIYQGYLDIRDPAAETGLRVPYWCAVASTEPRHITLLTEVLQSVPGSAFQVFFRVTDPAGRMVAAEPGAMVLEGGGRVLSMTSLDPLYPGVWDLQVRLGDAPGNNVFALEAGGLRKEVVIETRAR
jgi:hypothetical protein